MTGRIANLARWEVFKLRRRWMLWILLAFAILFGQLAVWAQYFSHQDLRETGGELPVPAAVRQGAAPRTVACNDLLSGEPARQPEGLDPQVVAGLAAQCRVQAATLDERLARGYAAFTLPGSLSTALGTVQQLGLILIAILAASAVGIDYGSGTLRPVLTQGTGRWPYLTAKLITLAVLMGLGLVVTLLTVAVSSLIAEGLVTAATVPLADPPTWGDAGFALWKAWSSLIPYLALATFVTILARSSTAGMSIGLGYYFFEQLITALLSAVFEWFREVANFLLVRNITAWTQDGAQGAGGGGALLGALPDTTHALVVLGVYTLALGAGAFVLFERRDVHGATGG